MSYQRIDQNCKVQSPREAGFYFLAATAVKGAKNLAKNFYPSIKKVALFVVLEADIDQPGIRELIHEADPQSRPVVINIFGHVVRTSVTYFSKQNKLKTKHFFQAKTMFVTSVTLGLAEWIIYDTCLVITYIHVCNLELSFWQDV